MMLRILIVLTIFSICSATIRPLSTTVVTGRSMEPSLHNGQIVLTTRNFGEPRRGDIVTAQIDGDTIIKRVAYVAGDIYHVNPKWGISTMNVHLTLAQNALGYNAIVPPGQVFLLGDNGPVSYDSRFFGTVDVKQIENRVIYDFKCIPDQYRPRAVGLANRAAAADRKD